MTCLTTICATRSATVGTPKIRWPPDFFGNGDGTYRRRKVASRAHPIPDLVEVVLQVGFELLDCLTIHARCTTFGFDRFIGFVHSLLLDVERLACRTHRSPPVSSCFDRTTA